MKLVRINLSGVLDLEVYSRCRCCLKKKLNASRPSEHPPVRGGGVSKRLGGIIGCKDKTSSWHLYAFPDDGSKIGSTSIMSGRNPPLLYCTLDLHY